MFPAFEALRGQRVILASASPRRIDIFNRVGFVPETMASGFPEDVDWRPFGPSGYVQMNAEKKIEWIAKELTCSPNPPAMIIGSDTVICCEGIVLEKASDRAHAREMLTWLSGKTLEVLTGVSIFYRDSTGEYQTKSFVETADVILKSYSSDIIEAYLDAGNGLDHAGALAIQEAGMVMVQGIAGDYFCVVGFPMSRFYQELVNIVPLMA